MLDFVAIMAGKIWNLIDICDVLVLIRRVKVRNVIDGGSTSMLGRKVRSL